MYISVNPISSIADCRSYFSFCHSVITLIFHVNINKLILRQWAITNLLNTLFRIEPILKAILLLIVGNFQNYVTNFRGCYDRIIKFMRVDINSASIIQPKNPSNVTTFLNLALECQSAEPNPVNVLILKYKDSQTDTIDFSFTSLDNL